MVILIRSNKISKSLLWIMLPFLLSQLAGCVAPTTQPPITEQHEITREEKIQSELR